MIVITQNELEIGSDMLLVSAQISDYFYTFNVCQQNLKLDTCEPYVNNNVYQTFMFNTKCLL